MKKKYLREVAAATRWALEITAKGTLRRNLLIDFLDEANTDFLFYYVLFQVF